MSIGVTMTVNGRQVTGEIEPRTLLVQFLRDHLRLTGTHIGCDTSQCGACVVLVDGLSVKSCTMLAVQCDGAAVTTIEGIAPAGAAPGALHPMQQAFRDHHGLQCGFCTPGMVMTALAIVARHPTPTPEQIKVGLEGNFCRCTGYHNIVAAIQAGAWAMQGRRQASGQEVAR